MAIPLISGLWHFTDGARGRQSCRFDHVTNRGKAHLRAPPISLPGHEIVTNRTGVFGVWGQKPEITGPVGHKFVSGHSPDTLLGGALTLFHFHEGIIESSVYMCDNLYLQFCCIYRCVSGLQASRQTRIPFEGTNEGTHTRTMDQIKVFFTPIMRH